MARRALDAYARFATRNRLLMLLVALVFVGAFAAFAPRVSFNNSPEVFFLKGDPTLEAYQRFKDVFESDEYSLIVLNAPSRWTPEFIGELRALVEGLQRIDHVRRVTAITNVRHIEGGAASINVGEFLTEGLTAADLAAKRREALSHPYYSGLYISEDGGHLGVVVETEIIEGEVGYKVDIANAIRGLLAQEPYAGWNAVAVGAPILDAQIRTIVQSESALFGAIAFLLVGLGFLLVFRSFLGLVLPLGIAASAIVVAFGVMGIMGWPAGLLTPIIPAFLVSVGIGSTIFLATHFYTATSQGRGVQEAISESFRESGVPCIVATLTTAGALLAFSSSRIAPVMQVGVTMGVALLGALIVTLLLTPVAFGLYRRPPRSRGRERMISGRLAVLDRVCEFVLRRHRAVLGGFLAVVAVAAIGVWKLDTDYYYLGTFKEDTRIRQAYDYVDRILPNSAAIEVLIRAHEPGAFKNPELLRDVAELDRYIERTSELPVHVYSLAGVVKEINQAVRGGKPEAYAIPDSRRLIAGELLLFESSDHDDLARVASRDYDVARLTVRLPNLPDSAYHDLVARIQDKAALLFANEGAPSATASVTGLVPLWMQISDYLTASQMKSVAIAFVVITTVMMLVFRSVTLGLVMSLMNALVIVLVLGVMGWIGMRLDPYTILIATIALGVLDDDTMHFVKQVQYAVDDGHGIADAVRHAYRSAGQAMLYTTVVLVVSFSAYAFSQVASLTKFGLLVALTLLLGMLMEFLITPAVLLALERGRARRPLAGEATERSC